jgi:hypothetical protein
VDSKTFVWNIVKGVPRGIWENPGAFWMIVLGLGMAIFAAVINSRRGR